MLTKATADYLRERSKIHTLHLDVSDDLDWFTVRESWTVRQFPDAKQLTDGPVIGATDFNVQLLRHLCTNIVFESPQAKLIFDSIALRIADQERRMEIAANFAATGAHRVIPGQEHLGHHQACGVDLALNAEGISIFCEQGTGKTCIGIARIMLEAEQVYAREKRPYRAIILAPNAVRLNWENEFQRFATRTGRVTIINGGIQQRVTQLIEAFTCDPDDEYTVVILGYDTLPVTWEALNIINWDLAILDESHSIKGHYTKRFKYAQFLRDTSRQRMIMTGTPIANTPLDLYAQFEFLGRGWSGFLSWKAFKSFYGVYEDTEHGDKLVALQNMPLLQEKLSRLSFVVKKEHVLQNLPPKLYSMREVEMTGEQLDFYKQLRCDLMVEIEATLATEPNKSIVINNILTSLLRLAQVTSGFKSFDPVVTPEGVVVRPRLIEYFDPNPKFQVLQEVLHDLGQYDKAIIWASQRPAIEYIAAALGSAAVSYYGAVSESQRQEAVHRYNNDPTVKYFVGNPSVGGVGLNLLGHQAHNDDDPYDTTHIIFYSQGWSSVVRRQAEDRAHRRGTRRPVNIIDLLCPKSIDSHIYLVVSNKIQMANAISDIRQLLQEILE